MPAHSKARGGSGRTARRKRDDGGRLPIRQGDPLPDLMDVILLIFGPKNLPKLGSALGKTVKNLREGMGAGEKDVEEAADDEEVVEVVEEVVEEPAAAPKKTVKKVVKKKAE